MEHAYAYNVCTSVELVEIEAEENAGQAEEPRSEIQLSESCADTTPGMMSEARIAFLAVRRLRRERRARVRATVRSGAAI